MYCITLQERLRVYYELIQQQEEDEKQRVEDEKQRVEAAKIGLTVGILTSYNSLISSLGEYRLQLRYMQLQDMVDKATDAMNHELVKALIDERSLLQLPSLQYTKQAISKDIETLIATCKSHYKHLSQQDAFNEDLSERCATMTKLLNSLLIQLSNSCDTSVEIEAIQVFLSTVEQNYKPLDELPVITTFSNLDSTKPDTDDYGVKEETPESLGISSELTKRYTALFDSLEVYRDKDAVTELDKQIEKAVDELNTVLQVQLKTKRSRFKTGSKMLTLKDVSDSTSSLVSSIRKYYKDQAARSDTTFDVATGERCARTITYLEEVQSSISNKDALVSTLRKRFTKSVAGDFNFPEGVESLEWADIKVKGSSPEEVIIGEGSFGVVIKAEIRLKLGWKDVAVKVFNQKFDKEYVDVCNSALQEAGVIASATRCMFNKDGIVNLYGVALGPLTSELSSFFGLQDGKSRVGIVMKYEAGGTLHDLTHPKPGQMKYDLKLPVKLQILLGIADTLRDLLSLIHISEPTRLLSIS